MGRSSGWMVGLGVCLLAASSPVQAQQATADEFNRDLVNVWGSLRPALQRMIATEAQNQITGLNTTSGIAQISVRGYRGMGFSIQNAPGLTQLSPTQIGLRVPLQGTWGFETEAEVRVKLNLWFMRPTIDIPIKLIIEDLKAEFQATIDLTDPLRPVLGQVGQPNVDFQIKLRSRQWLWNLLFQLLSPVGDYFAHKLVNDALNDLAPTLAGLSGYPGPIPADGAPAYTDSGQPMPFAEIAQNVDAKIRAHHTPFGPILSTHMDTDDQSSWEDAYKNGGSGINGNVVNYHSGGDSAIWTGHYLASQAYRYAANGGDPVSLQSVKDVLAGIDKLFKVNGDTGLLARTAAPVNSQPGQNIVARNNPFSRRAMIGGVEWIGRPGSKGISRDQYSGVMFGLSITYDLVPDPAVRAECVRINNMVLDYLMPRDWIVDEDRPPLDQGNGSRGPIFWIGIVNQKLAYLLDAMRMNPGNQAYVAEFNRSAPIASLSWIQGWSATFGFDHYYKYNLSHSAYYNYFRLETDQARWQEMARGYWIMQRYVGHHRNAHFDLIKTSIDPSSSAATFPGVRESFRRFLRRRHREITPPVIDLSGYTFVPMTFSAYTNPAGGGFGAATSTVQVPTVPLEFEHRRYSGNFHWQKDPFTPAQPNHGSPKSEKHGLDVVLPYWMGKVFGAF